MSLLEKLKNESYFFPDLVPYQFGDEPPYQRVRRVGWIDAEHDFPTGNVAPAVLSKLDAIKASVWPVVFHFGLIRGSYSCTLCRAGDRAGSSTQLLIPDTDDAGYYFGCLSMIDHFIRDHAYCPPEAFIRSVLAVDLKQPFDAQITYDEAHFSDDDMRAVYEIRASSLAGSSIPEHLRYRRWLEKKGHWPPRERDKDTHPSENSDTNERTSPID